MDEASGVVDRASAATRQFEEASAPFEGRWHRLISTTNWEKGRIICQWREALVAAGSPPVEHSDEAWSRRVGCVSGQHVGRLRRVFQRFGHVSEQYAGLYWSHFQAALDWDDAEMWLEGAVQNGWSISQMRITRGETLGVITEPPQDEVFSADEGDEDLGGPLDEQPPASSRNLTDERPPRTAAGDEAPRGDASGESGSSAGDGAVCAEDEARATVQPVRPFAQLPDLPADLAEAFEAFKLAILRHKTEKWIQISADEVLASLQALQDLVRAPDDDASPF